MVIKKRYHRLEKISYHVHQGEKNGGVCIMIVKDEFLSKLRRYFSLNLYEVKVWTALLSRGVSTAGELSDIANVPRSRSYDVLESLEKKGFVIMKLGKPIKYLAISPQDVVSRVKKNMVTDAEEKVKRLDSMKGTELLSELNTLHTQGIELIEPADLAGAVRGRLNLNNQMESIIIFGNCAARRCFPRQKEYGN